MPVLSGSSGRAIAEALAPLLGMESVDLISRRFPDGEGYVRVIDDKGFCCPSCDAPIRRR